MPTGPRATGVVIRDRKVLLVRDRGTRNYSLPGGGIHRGEPSISAAARELFEELGISAHKIERVGAYQSRTRRHTVYLITEFRGRPQTKSEIDAFAWWDGKSRIGVFRYVTEILGLVHDQFPKI
ncbi:MAG: NUDIX domain-containing protein [Chloroflexi bacterium]|nr:NUDIX domain-containing protein [Chloroflexota bacterium]